MTQAKGWIIEVERRGEWIQSGDPQAGRTAARAVRKQLRADGITEIIQIRSIPAATCALPPGHSKMLYRTSHRKKNAANTREWYWLNHDRELAKQRADYAEFKVEINAGKRAWRQSRKEKGMVVT